VKFPGARLLARVVLALVAVAAVVVAVVGCSSSDTSGTTADSAKVGSCLDGIKGATVDVKTGSVDCSSEKAVYKIAQTADKKGACSTDYTEASVAGGSAAFLCLVPNFKQGSCYNENPASGFKQVDCGATEATFRVVKRVDGEADELLCGQDADSFRLISAAPKTTYCLAKPKKA
jgi:hypothetical protein